MAVTGKKAKPSHPPYKAMLKSAVRKLNDPKGSSRQAILKYILSNYKVGDEKKAASRLRVALQKAVKNGDLSSAKGAGASGSFKAAKKAGKRKAKKSPAKKPAAKKIAAPKKPAAKKASAPKKAAPKKAKSPKRKAKKGGRKAKK